MAPQPTPEAGLSKAIKQEVMGLYQQHAAKLTRYAASLAHNHDGARDAVQEAFLRYCIERRYGRQIEHPRAWLYYVLRNYLLDRQRSAGNREVIAEDLDQLPGGHSNPEGILHRSELVQQIAERLTGREFDCLRLRAQGLGYAEIAGVLGIRTGTVGALLARAQKKLRTSASLRSTSPLQSNSWSYDHGPARC